MQGAAVVVMCVLAAVSYGIVHDQISARICIEYFTIGHPQILRVPTQSPTLLGFVWGIVATWWVGAGLGLPLAAAARLGPRRKVDCSELVRPLILLMAVAAVLAAISGLVGYISARQGWVGLSGSLGAEVPVDRHDAFLADAFAHSMSYLVGAVGGLVLIVRTWRARRFSVAPPSA